MQRPNDAIKRLTISPHHNRMVDEITEKERDVLALLRYVKALEKDRDEWRALCEACQQTLVECVGEE